MKAPDFTPAEEFTLSLLSFGGADALFAHPWTQDMFPAHPAVFSMIRDAITSNEPHDAVSIAHRLAKIGLLDGTGGAGKVVSILSEAGKSQPHALRMYYDDLSAAARYRRVAQAITEALPEVTAQTADLSTVIETLSRAADARDQAPQATLKNQVGQLLAQLEQRTPPERFSSGIANLDRALGGGVERGEMLVAAGATGGGKSVILGQFALAACEADKAVAVFSLEMPAPSVIARLASNQGNVRVRPVSEWPAPNTGEMHAMSRALLRIGSFKLTIRDRVNTLDDIIADARRLIRAGAADLVIVDYLQRIEHAGDTREQAVNECARRLKSLAMESNVAVITASQLNDDGRLRESRAIGMEADAVVSITGESDGLLLSKFRRGKPFVSLPVVLKGALSRFEAVKEAA